MPNRLAHETSPYLQQHADNPVDWYPWGEDALERARREDKPILLSIGYSACHWCHVMAHESFENAQVAAVMNEHFVNIKVDREERPDVDQIYQLAQQMLTRRTGGWPLTMFLTPDQVPFFGGTYFPKSARYNLPGFVQIMERVIEAYRTRRGDIDAQNRAVFAALNERGTSASADTATPLSWAPLERATAMLSSNFDRANGGFGGAPKFPHPSDLVLLLRESARRDDPDARHVVLHTLTKMAEGGIYDHLGGGFCRYSVDAHWHIPHFEKMLYDNGPLLRLYADAWTVTKSPLFARVVEETAAWLMREMQSPEGGYYSSLDADSEGEEGKYYVWTPDAVRRLVTAAEFAVVAPHWGLEDAPNFEHAHWHLRVARSLAVIAAKLDQSEEACARLVASARTKLFAAREQRVRPARDDKVLTSWNALAIAGMARAARVFDRADWLDSAQRAFAFLRTTLWRDGRLLATYKDGRAHLNAYLDDYAFLIDAALELLQARFAAGDLALARSLADALLQHFEDSAHGGGFFFTSHDHERLIQRSKTAFDNATPSGNGVAAVALTRLGHITGEARYLAAAERAVRAFHGPLQEHPPAHASLLAALAECVTPTSIAILAGERDATRPWLQRLASAYRPDLVVIALDPACDGAPSALAKPAPAAGVNAYVCQGVTCSPPVASLGELEAMLAAKGVPAQG
jgi:hypothetical protein